MTTKLAGPVQTLFIFYQYGVTAPYNQLGGFIDEVTDDGSESTLARSLRTVVVYGFASSENSHRENWLKCAVSTVCALEILAIAVQFGGMPPKLLIFPVKRLR